MVLFSAAGLIIPDKAGLLDFGNHHGHGLFYLLFITAQAEQDVWLITEMGQAG
jgi:hypothetical protein